MFYLFVSTLVAIASAAPATESPDSGIYVVPNDTASCAKDLVDWCSGMKYPQQGVGMSMISISMRTRAEGHVRVLCTSDTEGTNCTKNGRQWFACTKDHEFTYEGQKLDPENAPPEGVCESAEMAFNDIMVQNLSYDNETVSKAIEKGMEGFFKEMADMREMIENLSRRLSSLFGPPWVGGMGNFWGDDDDFSEGVGEGPLYPDNYEREREN